MRDRAHDPLPATDELFAQLYAELRRLALARMRHEPAGHTFSPTDLVHEAYLRLARAPGSGWQNQRHFFASAAEAMRRILVEWARGKARSKRGGGRRRTTLSDRALRDQPTAGGVSADEVLDVDRALERLRLQDPAMADVVVLRYFGGLTTEETAQALGATARTIYRKWRAARTWLYSEISDRS